MIEDALKGDPYIGIIQPKVIYSESSPEVFDVGTVGQIAESQKLPDGRFLITLKGVMRFRIESEPKREGKLYRHAVVSYDEFLKDSERHVCEYDMGRIIDLLEDYVKDKPYEIDFQRLKSGSAGDHIDELCQALHFPVDEKQLLLEAKNASTRGEKLVALLEMSRAELEYGSYQLH